MDELNDEESLTGLKTPRILPEEEASSTIDTLAARYVLYGLHCRLFLGWLPLLVMWAYAVKMGLSWISLDHTLLMSIILHSVRLQDMFG